MEVIYVAGIVLVLLTLLLGLLYLRARKGLPVLMYHKVSARDQDSLTVSVQQLESHLRYLKQQGYTPVSCRQLLDSIASGTPLPRRPVLLTFDDAYVNNLQLALPLLLQYKMPATLFVPTAYIGKTNAWDQGQEPLMSIAQLQEWVNAGMEVGLHGHRHFNYRRAESPAHIEEDLENAMHTLRRTGIPFVPAVAYPYGGFPREQELQQAFYTSLQQSGYKLGFRIGNSINQLPASNPLLLKRIDIKGTDSFTVFRLKTALGKIKL